MGDEAKNVIGFLHFLFVKCSNLFSGVLAEPKEKNEENQEEEKEPKPPSPLVLVVDLHCKGCANKIKTTIMKIKGVEGVVTNIAQNQVTVKGIVKPNAVCLRIWYENNRRAEVLSPLPAAEGEPMPEVVSSQVINGLMTVEGAQNERSTKRPDRAEHREGHDYRDHGCKPGHQKVSPDSPQPEPEKPGEKKEAAASRFSPFEVSEAVTPNTHDSVRNSKKFEACNGLSLQGYQVFNVNTNYAVRVFSQKPNEEFEEYHENGCMENGFSPSAKSPSGVTHSFTEHGTDDAVKAGSCSTKPSYGHGVQFSDDDHKPRKEDAVLNNSKSNADYKPSNTTQPSLEEVKFKSETCVPDTGMNVYDASEDSLSHVPFHATKHVLFSSSFGQDAPSKLAKPHGATRESPFPQQGTSDQFLGELHDLHKGASVEVANVMAHEEKRHNILSGTKDEKFRNFDSERDDADIVENDNMTEAIKKALVENFPGEEETQPQPLLYKNLWLEAEAVIFSRNCRARFDRMKTEMGKCKSHEAKVM